MDRRYIPPIVVVLGLCFWLAFFLYLVIGG